jgi:hypothetical protein
LLRREREMGTGWRRALCTSVQRDDHDADAKAKKRRPHDAGASSSSSKGSNPALRCRTKPLQEPPPPRSPSTFALLKASLLPSKVTCTH